MKEETSPTSKRDEYLKRLDYQGPTNPNLNLLKNLQKQHLFHIPFENLDIHWKRPIVLNTDSFFEKIVINKRGGFCYELNELYYALLIDLGFSAERISARVHVEGDEYGKEFDHFSILVSVGNQQYLTDVGFGNFTQYPLSLDTEEIQIDPNGAFKVSPYRDDYWLISDVKEAEENPIFIFSKTPRELSDYSGMCHYHQSSSESHFTRNKMISLATKSGRIILTDRVLKIRQGDELSETPIHTTAQFNQYLLKHFGITAPV